MNHDYSAEQKAYHGGLMDKFVEFTGSTAPGCDPKQVMGYFDGEYCYCILELCPALFNE